MRFSFGNAQEEIKCTSFQIKNVLGWVVDLIKEDLLCTSVIICTEEIAAKQNVLAMKY